MFFTLSTVLWVYLDVNISIKCSKENRNPPVVAGDGRTILYFVRKNVNKEDIFVFASAPTGTVGITQHIVLYTLHKKASVVWHVRKEKIF